MKELFNKFKRMPLSSAKNLILVDTCFFISIFSHHEHIEQFQKLKNKAMTSFNVQELIKVDHKLHHLKHEIRKFFQDIEKDNLKIIDINVEPGSRDKETEFVNSIEPELLKHCKDPSDAVLLAAAIKTHSTILTKDKHHLFTVDLENFINKYSIRIQKELRDIS